MSNLQKIICKSQQDVSDKALILLYQFINSSTLLLLSGGSTPKPLYQIIAREKTLKPGAVALVDERYGDEFHLNSNEQMIKSTGLVDYLNYQNIPFNKILEDQGLDKTAQDYEVKIRDLFVKFPQKIAVMGIGEDGHTAGILPKTSYDHDRWVIGYQNLKDSFKGRITLTFESLSQVNLFLILVVGENKRSGFNLALNSTDKFKAPACCFRSFLSDSYLITDLDFT